MLPTEPETFEQIKARFVEAIREPVDLESVRAGTRKPPSGERKHVFDFEDGMRMIVSVDLIVDTYFLHISVSGNKHYHHTIKDEGFDGMVEDVLLRVTAFTGGAPGHELQAVLSEEGVLHIMFEVDHEGLIERSQRA